MTAKKPRFEPRVEWVRVHPTVKSKGYSIECRITDARDLTAEQAIADTITRNVYLDGDGPLDSTHVPEGYSARVVNGKVRVRRVGP